MKRLLLGLSATALLAAPAQGATLLRLDGIGPLKLGMSQTAGVGTKWLSNRGTGCVLGGKPYPVTYRLDGPKAPKGINGGAEFNDGKLTSLTFRSGVRTAVGVVPGQTTWAGMAARYRDAGFKVQTRFDATFQGTFVHVRRSGKSVMTAFADKKVIDTLGVPYLPLCE